MPKLNDLYFNKNEWKKRPQIINCDFETTNRDDEENEVYLWSMTFKDNNPTKRPLFKNRSVKKKYPLIRFRKGSEGTTQIWGIRIEDFIGLINEPKARSTIFYFQNGSKFDVSYIVRALVKMKWNLRQDLNVVLENNYDEYIENVKNIQNKYMDEKQQNRLNHKESLQDKNDYLDKFWINNNLEEKDFSLLIKDGEYYQLLFRDAKIWDSKLLFNLSIAEQAKTLNKDLNTNIYEKLDLYDNYSRTELYKDIDEAINDDNSVDYVCNDSFINWKFMDYIKDFIPQNLWNMTSSSTAYQTWNDYFAEERLNKFTNENIITTKQKGWSTVFYDNIGRKIGNKWHVKNWINNLYFPTNWITNDLYKELSNSYSGGLSVNNPIYQGIILDNIITVDDILHYSKIMKSEKVLLPIGEPDPNGNWGIYKITIKNEIKNEKGIPFIYEKKGFKTNNYQSILYPGQEFYISEPELWRFTVYYSNRENIDYEIETILKFKSVTSDVLFGGYIDEIYNLILEAKLNGKDALAIALKMLSNGVHGKLGTKPFNEVPYFDQGKITGKILLENKTKYYFPLAIAITAAGRMNLVDTIGNNWNKVAFSNVDSIHAIVPNEIDNKSKAKEWMENNFNLTIDDYEIGNWRIERFNSFALYRKVNSYMLLNKETYEWTYKISGMRINNTSKLSNLRGKSIDYLDFGNMITGFNNKQLKRSRKYGSVSLIEYNRTLEPIWNDDDKLEKINWRTKDKELLEREMNKNERIKRMINRK